MKLKKLIKKEFRKLGNPDIDIDVIDAIEDYITVRVKISLGSGSEGYYTITASNKRLIKEAFKYFGIELSNIMWRKLYDEDKSHPLLSKKQKIDSLSIIDDLNPSSGEY